MKKFFLISSLVTLVSCSTAQVETIRDYQSKIESACSLAKLFISPINKMYPWVYGGCATQEGISKLVLDSNSLNWLNDMISKAKN